MNRQVLFPLLTLIVGIVLGFGVQAYLYPPSERSSLREQAVVLSQNLNVEKSSLAQTEQRLAQVTQANIALETELKREKEKASTLPSAPAPAKASPFEEMMRAAMDNQLNTRIENLATILHLSPEQVARLKQAILKAKEEEGKADKTTPNLSSTFTALENELNLMLNAEQKKAYADFKTRERNSQIEMTANMETSQLQNSLNLTPEQSDQVFAKLAELGQEQFKPTLGQTDPAKILREMADRKKEALRSTLSAEQFKAYEQYLDNQTEIALKMMPAMQSR